MSEVVTPMVGDLLADRYSLAAHVNDDSTGRQVWRGMDVLLNRPVTVVLRTPGGEEAQEMLAAAVAASRVNHPNIVGVYDAVDQGDCAYIVREWVEGQSLRDSIAAAPLPPEAAINIVQCVAEAIAAVHATGVAHGNVHPGTVLLSTDDRVVLADPRADAGATQVGDVRSIAATLYCAMTGGWPRTVPGPASLPDAPTDDQGMPLSLKEIRPEVPARVDRLVTRLLSAAEAPPTAAELADELAHLSVGPDTSALALVVPDEEAPQALPPRIAGKRLAYGAAALVGLALIGLIATLILIPSTGGTDANGGTDGGKSSQDSGNSGAPQQIDFKTADVQAIDPTHSDADVIKGVGNVVDGDSSSAWQTQAYNSAKWGNLAKGFGLLLDMGSEKRIATVTIDMATTGNTVGLYAGKGDTASDGDVGKLDVIAKDQVNNDNNLKFTAVTDAPKTRYLLIWCSAAGPDPKGGGQFQWVVNDIQVHAS
ncbi:MAG TPA: protein kinase family protein [Stackebrandtia sp.]|uniref:protein kinase family protein n=1 Tax=Stackebrandtia sp. TaxID=2023065 RepID=UPI002D24D75E|nr:protein kinase family protein [Stackebrandtia sp.]HZE38007.1 protein kinase family protein [Stackebrandtia sp.]